MFLLLDKLIQKTRNSYNDVSLFEEIFENILIILSSIGEELSDDNQWDAIVNNIIEIYEYIRQHKISKKIMFKISDVLDDLDIDYE